MAKFDKSMTTGTGPMFRCAKCRRYHLGLGNPLFLWLKLAIVCDSCGKEIEDDVDFDAEREACIHCESSYLN